MTLPLVINRVLLILKILVICIVCSSIISIFIVLPLGAQKMPPPPPHKVPGEQSILISPQDPTQTQTQTQSWYKTFGGSNDDDAHSVQQTSDGGYIVAGWTKSYGAGGQDAWLIKTDSSGNKLWEKTIGGSNDDRVNSIQQTNDGGYIIAGITASLQDYHDYPWLIKTDPAGNKLWEKTFGGSNDDDDALSVQQTSDGGYIVVGYTNSYGAGGQDAWLIKTDPSGNKLWEKTFDRSNDARAISVQQTRDNEYIVAGYSGDYDVDAWLIKTDSSGNKLWEKTFGGSNQDQAYSVQQTNDSGYIIAGKTQSYGAAAGEAWLIKTDSSGNKLWDKTFGGLYAASVRQTSDAGFIIAAETSTLDLWLIKTDSEGNKLWDSIFGNLDMEINSVGSAQQTNDGGYIIVGTNGSRAWLIKTDQNGSVEDSGAKISQMTQENKEHIAYSLPKVFSSANISEAENHLSDSSASEKKMPLPLPHESATIEPKYENTLLPACPSQPGTAVYI